MLSVDTIKSAAGGIVAAALLAQGWEAALERFAQAADARDAVLMRNTPSRMVKALATGESAGAVAQFAAGNAPPNSRYKRVRTSPLLGFRIDHDDYADEELAQDPFYQEFLRPNGVFWHANVVMTSGRDEYVELSLKRRIERGPYQPEDVAVLDAACRNCAPLRSSPRLPSMPRRAE